MEEEKNLNVIRISPQEYALLEEEANKVLESIDPETIDNLRKYVNKELDSIISLLTKYYETYSMTLNRIKSEPKHVPYNSKSNPFVGRKKKFWLTQLAKFIAVAIFKIPLEITPTIEYPHNVDKRATDFEVKYEEFSNKFDLMIMKSVPKYKYCIESFNHIKKNINSNNSNFIIFLNSINKSSQYFNDFSKENTILRTIFYDNNCYLNNEILNDVQYSKEFFAFFPEINSYYLSSLNKKKSYKR